MRCRYCWDDCSLRHETCASRICQEIHGTSWSGRHEEQRNKNVKPLLKTIVDSSVAVLFAAAVIHAQAIRLGAITQIYSDDQLNNVLSMDGGKSVTLDGSGNFIIDAPLGTIKKSGTEMYFFASSRQGVDKYSGTPELPFQSRVWEKSRDSLWTNPMIFAHDVDPRLGPYWRDVPWISNIYKCDDGGLLGFVHVECSLVPHDADHFYQTCTYKIGLAYSRDSGEKWTYCGDVLFTKDRIGPWRTTYPCNGFVCPGNGLSNIEGIPYIVKNDSFYVYFMDYDYSAPHAGRVSVARANAGEVIACVRRVSPGSADAGALRTQIPWKKFDGTSWTVDGACTTQAGAPLLNRLPGGSGFDIHGDAVYCKPLQAYLLTVNTGDDGRLFLYVSRDGTDWNSALPLEIDNCPGSRMQHSFFVTLGPDASDDCRVVGNEFYVVWPRTSTAYGMMQSLYRRKITVVSDTVSVR
jgi:hypothetical protein